MGYPPHDMENTEEQHVAGAIDRIRELLVPDERLEAYAVQRRLFALSHRRVIAAATSGRLMIVRRGFFAGFEMQDVRWQDLASAGLREGVFASELTISTHDGRRLVLAGVRKADARKVYVLCQAQEQAWREKNRVREMEEMRAKSGGVHLSGAALGVPPSGGAEDTTARLQRAKQMLDQGLITDAEYESLKAKILTSL